MAIKRRISDIKPLLTNLAQTSHYEVQFGGLPDQLKNYLRKRGITSAFVVGDAGLLCYSAVLPTSNLGTNTISGNFMGVQEKFAHTRLYDTLTLDFYIDNNYKSLKFIESWMEFIASGSYNPQGLGENASIRQNNQGYFSRMQYPAYYKSNSTRIIKFDRDYRREIEYNFVGLFPSSISSIPISYVASDTLKMSATFQYDRYIAGKALSINQYLGDSNNKEPNIPTTPVNTTSTLVPVRGQSGVVFYDSSIDTRTSAEVNRRFFNASGQPIIN